MNEGQDYYIIKYLYGYRNHSGIFIGRFKKKLENLNSIPGTLRGRVLPNGPYAEFSSLMYKEYPREGPRYTREDLDKFKYLAKYDGNQGYKFFTVPSDSLRAKKYINLDPNIPLSQEASNKIRLFLDKPGTKL